MLQEIQAHIKGLINEINIQNDDPTQITISINIAERVTTTASSKNRIYSSTGLKGDEGDYIFCSISKDQYTESFAEMDGQ